MIETLQYMPIIVPRETGLQTPEESIICERCDSGGTPNNNGQYLLLSCEIKHAKYSKVALELSYKAHSATSWTTVTLLQQAYYDDTDYYTGVLTRQNNELFSNEIVYDIRLKTYDVDDPAMRTTQNFTLPTGETFISCPAGGKNFGIFKHADTAKSKVLEVGGTVEAEGYKLGNNNMDVVISQGTTQLGWYKREWQSGFTEAWKTESITLAASDWGTWGNLILAFPPKILLPTGFSTDIIQITPNFYTDYYYVIPFISKVVDRDVYIGLMRHNAVALTGTLTLYVAKHTST